MVDVVKLVYYVVNFFYKIGKIVKKSEGCNDFVNKMFVFDLEKKERMDEKEGKKLKKFLRKGIKEKERKKLS